jgi:transposase
LQIGKHEVIANQKKRGPKRKILQTHVDYLCDPTNLKRWCGKTLNVRARLFHRQFPNLTISAEHLGYIYKQNLVKKKKIKVFKTLTPKQQGSKEQQLRDISTQLRDLTSKGYKILFVDETMFTYQTNYRSDYMVKGANMRLPQSSYRGDTIAMVAAVSADFGFEYYQLFYKAVDRDLFMEFIENLREDQGDDKIAIFLDNLRVHHTLKVKELCKSLDIPLVFNLPYSPDYNPIETYFSLLKNLFKRMKLSYIANGNAIDVPLMVDKCADRV